jgi:hypothetical protein
VIPKIKIDKYSALWEQPNKNNILLDDNYARMNAKDFIKLKEYSTSFPTDAYLGKMWKRLEGDRWFLCWYGEHESPGKCSVNYREIRLL